MAHYKIPILVSILVFSILLLDVAYAYKEDYHDYGPEKCYDDKCHDYPIKCSDDIKCKDFPKVCSDCKYLNCGRCQRCHKDKNGKAFCGDISCGGSSCPRGCHCERNHWGHPVCVEGRPTTRPSTITGVTTVPITTGPITTTTTGPITTTTTTGPITTTTTTTASPTTTTTVSPTTTTTASPTTTTTVSPTTTTTVSPTTTTTVSPTTTTTGPAPTTTTTAAPTTTTTDTPTATTTTTGDPTTTTTTTTGDLITTTTTTTGIPTTTTTTSPDPRCDGTLFASHRVTSVTTVQKINPIDLTSQIVTTNRLRGFDAMSFFPNESVVYAVQNVDPFSFSAQSILKLDPITFEVIADLGDPEGVLNGIEILVGAVTHDGFFVVADISYQVFVFDITVNPPVFVATYSNNMLNPLGWASSPIVVDGKTVIYGYVAQEQSVVSFDPYTGVSTFLFEVPLIGRTPCSTTFHDYPFRDLIFLCHHSDTVQSVYTVNLDNGEAVLHGDVDQPFPGAMDLVSCHDWVGQEAFNGWSWWPWGF